MILLDTDHLSVLVHGGDNRHGILNERMSDSLDQDFAIQ
jgi:hypothetical protein